MIGFDWNSLWFGNQSARQSVAHPFVEPFLIRLTISKYFDRDWSIFQKFVYFTKLWSFWIMKINSPVHLFELSFELIFWFWQIFNFDRELTAFYIYLQFGIRNWLHLFVICNWFWLGFIMIWKSIRPWISSNPVCRTISNQISKDFDRDWSIFQQFTSILQMIILNTVTKFDRESIYNVLHLFVIRN